MRVSALRNLFLAAALVAPSFCAMGETAPYDHMHLTATDPAEAAEWYIKYMGGEPMEAKGRAAFGSTIVIFFKKDAGFPGSEGSSVDHIGFSFTDLPAKMEDFEAAGIKITSEVREVPGKFKFAFIEDPWGTKIEVMEDEETLGFHHIHLSSAEPAKTLDWYENVFGGERTKYKGMLDALRYGTVWLLAQNSRGAEVAPTQGRAIDHLGWGFADLDAAAVVLKSKGVNFTMEPRPFRDLKIAFIEGPDGVRIELVQRPAK